MKPSQGGRGTRMKKVRCVAKSRRIVMPSNRILTAFLIAASLGGCAALERDSVTNRENDLSAAGFTVLPASTPARQTMLNTLPADRLSQRIEGEHVSYLYPDPLVCHCLYIGSQAAYGRFQQARQQRQIASDQLRASESFNDPGWDWGPWCGYGRNFY